MEVLATDTVSQQERLQAIAEKRRKQAEIESKRRQLEDDRRQLQYLKSKALRERWLLEGTPSSASEGDEDMRKQMQEVDELIHKADEVTLSEAGSTTGPAEPRGLAEDVTRTTPSRREITGVEAQPGEATSGPPGIQPGQEPPVTMVFMGYQNVEDEAETKKVLGLQDTIKAELVVIEDSVTPREPAPLNGSAAELPATKEENQTGPTTTPSDTQDLDMKKPRCRCCSVM